LNSAAECDAGPFSEWLEAMRAVLRGERAAQVPCGTCVGCCVSSYPIPLRPADRIAQEQVPEQYLIHSPGIKAGHLLMGFRDDGSCPMFEMGCCSIYPHRPQTCREYDCRIHAAAGTLPAGDRPLIHQRVNAWRFSYPRPEDGHQSRAVLRAARFIEAHSSEFPASIRATSPTAVAVLAVKVYPLFAAMPDDPLLDETGVRQRVAQVLEAVRAFDG
jgi:uncharacterized protein